MSQLARAPDRRCIPTQVACEKSSRSGRLPQPTTENSVTANQAATADCWSENADLSAQPCPKRQSKHLTGETLEREIGAPCQTLFERSTIRAPCTNIVRAGKIGAPGTIRTSDPQIRSLMLYPAELRARALEAGLIAACAGHCNLFLAVLGNILMSARQIPILLLFPLAACGARGGDWPTLAPRAGEISPMVPRNVAGQLRCPAAVDCAPPAVAAAPEFVAPQPPALPAAAVLAELTQIEAKMDAIEREAVTARRDAVTARAAAGTVGMESATAARAVAAETRLAAVLQPLAGLAFRLDELAAATANASDRAAYTDRLAALSRRVAEMDPQ